MQHKRRFDKSWDKKGGSFNGNPKKKFRGEKRDFS